MLWYKLVTTVFIICLFYCMALLWANPTGGNLVRLLGLLVAQFFASAVNWMDVEAANNNGKIYKRD
ncbi:hypothetical protein DUG50_22760 [Salmonella enterica subsp. enterica serovar Miami]|nr:hypothetical protein [Salmonella enterica subsp. enterica serovar Miami]